MVGADAENAGLHDRSYTHDMMPAEVSGGSASDRNSFYQRYGVYEAPC
jgi:hypothetical protein